MRTSSSKSQQTLPHASFKQRTYAITRHGKEMFLERLQQLGRLRSDIFEQIKTLKDQQADEPFDLAAKLAEVQQIDNEIYRLDAILARSEALSVRNRDTVSVGCKVKLESQGQEMNLVLVNSVEADPSNGFISSESPIGRLLIGRHLDEIVVLDSPRTKHKVFRIKDISHAAI
jgi:transcription elongation factor GreA